MSPNLPAKHILQVYRHEVKRDTAASINQLEPTGTLRKVW